MSHSSILVFNHEVEQLQTNRHFKLHVTSPFRGIESGASPFTVPSHLTPSYAHSHTGTHDILSHLQRCVYFFLDFFILLH